MIALIIVLLLLAAVCFGVFFLIFKLIWALLKKSGNKGPLIASGVTTAVLGVVLAIGVAMLVHTYVRPFQPLIESAKNKTSVTTGVRSYTDPVYRFTLNTFGGTEFSEWVNMDDVNLKIGFDTNIIPLSKTATNKDDIPFSALAVIRVSDDDKMDPKYVYNTVLTALRQYANAGDSRGQLSLSEPTYNIPAGVNGSMYVAGVFTPNSSQTSKPIHLALLVAPEEYEAFYVIGFAIADDAYVAQLENEIKSFRLPSQPAIASQPAQQPQPAFEPTYTIMD